MVQNYFLLIKMNTQSIILPVSFILHIQDLLSEEMILTNDRVNKINQTLYSINI